MRSSENVVRLFEDAGMEEQQRANAVFDELWKLWPVKAGKVIARQKFLGITKGGLRTRSLDKSSGEFIPLELSATPEQILAGAKAYLASQIDRNTYRLKDEGRFIPHLSTWMGRGGWMDFE